MSEYTRAHGGLELSDACERQSDQFQIQIDRVIRPMLQLLAENLPPADHHLVGLLDSALREMLDPFVGRLDSLAAGLTRRETEVCHMVRNGLSSKQIASALNTSVGTVHNQRRSIRRKLSIVDRVTNLEAFLKNS